MFRLFDGLAYCRGVAGAHGAGARAPGYSGGKCFGGSCGRAADGGRCRRHRENNPPDLSRTLFRLRIPLPYISVSFVNVGFPQGECSFCQLGNRVPRLFLPGRKALGTLALAKRRFKWGLPLIVPSQEELKFKFVLSMQLERDPGSIHCTVETRMPQTHPCNAASMPRPHFFARHPPTSQIFAAGRSCKRNLRMRLSAEQ